MTKTTGTDVGGLAGGLSSTMEEQAKQTKKRPYLTIEELEAKLKARELEGAPPYINGVNGTKSAYLCRGSAKI